jgi:microsomal epoxide hydrolase
VTLSVLEAGREHAHGRSVTLAFIPGWSMPGSLWQLQLEDLGRRYHTLALDPRGQGESQVPSSGYTAERRAMDLDEFLRSRANVVLVGWSLGALESLQYIDMFGSRQLAGLVLVDSSVGEEPVPPSGANFKQRLRDNRAETLNAFVRAIFRTPRPEAEITGLVHGAERMKLEDSLALLSYPFDRSHWKRIVHAVDRPLLYVVTPQFEQQAQNLKKGRPGTQIDVFKSAGHALFVDEPQRFNVLLSRFVEGLSRSSGLRLPGATGGGVLSSGSVATLAVFGAGGVHLVFGPRGSMVSGKQW